VPDVILALAASAPPEPKAPPTPAGGDAAALPPAPGPWDASDSFRLIREPGRG
jgi:hypothetical protein